MLRRMRDTRSYFRISRAVAFDQKCLPSLANVHCPERGCSTSGGKSKSSSPARCGFKQSCTFLRTRMAARCLSPFSDVELVMPMMGIFRRERDMGPQTMVVWRNEGDAGVTASRDSGHGPVRIHQCCHRAPWRPQQRRLPHKPQDG